MSSPAWPEQEICNLLPQQLKRQGWSWIQKPKVDYQDLAPLPLLALSLAVLASFLGLSESWLQSAQSWIQQWRESASLCFSKSLRLLSRWLWLGWSKSYILLCEYREAKGHLLWILCPQWLAQVYTIYSRRSVYNCYTRL